MHLKDEVVSMSEILDIYAKSLDAVDTISQWADPDERMRYSEAMMINIDNTLVTLKAKAYDFIVNKVTFEHDFAMINIELIIQRVQNCRSALSQIYEHESRRHRREEEAAKSQVDTIFNEAAVAVESEDEDKTFSASSLYQPGDIIESRFVAPHNFYVTGVLENGDLRGFRLTRSGRINKRYQEEMTMTPRLYGKGKHRVVKREVPLSDIEIVEVDNEQEAEVTV